MSDIPEEDAEDRRELEEMSRAMMELVAQNDVLRAELHKATTLDVPLASGAFRIAKERDRQKHVEGWTAEHDQEHDRFELTRAAICYARRATALEESVPQFDKMNDGTRVVRLPADWPVNWHPEWWKPEPRVQGDRAPLIGRADSVRMLEKAGALIAAEIDRLVAVKAPAGVAEAAADMGADLRAAADPAGERVKPWQESPRRVFAFSAAILEEDQAFLERVVKMLERQARP